MISAEIFYRVSPKVIVWNKFSYVSELMQERAPGRISRRHVFVKKALKSCCGINCIPILI